MIYPSYAPEVYVEQVPVLVACNWWEDLQVDGSCRAPAMWLVLSGIGFAALALIARR